MHKKYVIAKYLRLSSDDGNDGESNSISNQRDLLDDYIRNNFETYDISYVELIDDGYSGTNFDRPSVKRLLALAESKQINCIIVKDFSRFGRDYIEVGGYLEEKLPCWQVRFISVNDNYDSNNYRGITSGIETALKNVAYTLYSRDLSEKVKSAQKIRKKKGEFLSPFAFYGYIKDPSNKNRIIVDEEAAPIVQRIFEMRASGISSKQIAITLNNEGVLTPAMYKANKDPECRRWNTVSEYNYWSAGNVDILLSNERYTGREQSIESVAELIYSVVKNRTGNYLVFFPSYAYMQDVYSMFCGRFEEVETVIQSSGMTEEEKEWFLELFIADSDKGIVGFAVLGGIFSEGIDLNGDRLSGAIIVGVGLPQISLERDIIKNYFNNKNGMGFEFSYIYPGMNKVLQAAGRVIRSETDKGTVLLIDDRFSQITYRKLFPQEWSHATKVKYMKVAENNTRCFWDKATK